MKHSLKEIYEDGNKTIILSEKHFGDDDCLEQFYQRDYNGNLKTVHNYKNGDFCNVNNYKLNFPLEPKEIVPEFLAEAYLIDGVLSTISSFQGDMFIQAEFNDNGSVREQSCYVFFGKNCFLHNENGPARYEHDTFGNVISKKYFLKDVEISENDFYNRKKVVEKKCDLCGRVSDIGLPCWYCGTMV
jgi:hypothetical protein